MSNTITVTLPTGDAQIWNKDEVIVNLAYAMSIGHNIEINCISEGPCLTTAGAYDILDLLSKKFTYDKSKISITHICNQLEYHSEYDIKISAPIKHVATLQNNLRTAPGEYKVFSDATKHFGNFISRGSRNRLLIGSRLHFKYKDKTLQTYHCTVNDDYHKASIFFDDLLWSEARQDYLDDAYNFLTRVTPITFPQEQIESYPIRDYKMYGINAAYPQIFVDIVCQTYSQGNTFYVDEKIWRPIMTKTPFIVQGSCHFIKNLQRLGFKTFNKWWNENYSEAPWNTQVYDIFKIIDNLSTISIDRLESIYEDMKPVLDHNYEKFMNLTETDFEIFRK